MFKSLSLKNVLKNNNHWNILVVTPAPFHWNMLLLRLSLLLLLTCICDLIGSFLDLVFERQNFKWCCSCSLNLLSVVNIIKERLWKKALHSSVLLKFTTCTPYNANSKTFHFYCLLLQGWVIITAGVCSSKPSLTTFCVLCSPVTFSIHILPLKMRTVLDSDLQREKKRQILGELVFIENN